MSFKTPESRSLATSSRRSAVRPSNKNVDSFLSDFNSFRIDNITSDIEELINRYMKIGDLENASLWIDAYYAKVTENDGDRSALKVAKFVELLTMTHQWARVNTVLWNEDKLFQRHIYFAYFHINAFFHQKQYNLIQTTPIAHLVNIQGIPIRWPTIIGGIDASLSGNEIPITSEESRQLDEWSISLNLKSSLLNVLGKTFINVGNRGAAAICFKHVLKMDPNCLQAEQIVLHHRLLESDEMFKLKKRFNERENSKEDPRILAAKAKDLYARGNPKEAVKITSNILNRFGWYLPCILTHVDSLTMLEDADALFILGHQLVDSMPDHHYTWYAVAMYYYACKTQPNCKGLAKQYMNKAVQMNDYFGEGYLALGHILAADSENDQALNSYYKAARLMEKNFEPYLYISTLYTTGGLDLANNFLNDALNYAPQSPIVLQQIGCLLYSECNYEEALANFEKALKLVMAGENMIEFAKLTKEPCEYLKTHKYNIERYWAPLLNNLGHCARRIGKHYEGHIYHEYALHLQPNDVKALGSHAICLMHTDNKEYGMQLLNKALAIQPFDSILREIQDTIITMYNDFEIVKSHDHPRNVSVENLDEFFAETSNIVTNKKEPNFHNKSVAKKLMKAAK